MITTADDVQRVFHEFWKDLVMVDDELDLEKVARELYDYYQTMEEVAKVYLHITNGRISKHTTVAAAVIDEAEEYYRKLFGEEDDEDVAV